MSGAPIERGTVLIRDGRITAVGADVAIPSDAQRVDATGKVVTPGLVNAATQLSVVDIGAVPATRNVSARGRDGIAAAFTVWDGLNPASVLLPPARAAGITTVVIAPRGGLLSGWTWLGVLTYILSFASWLYVLRHLPLSVAYGLITIVQVLVPLGARLFLGETISLQRWAGIALVLCGTIIVAQSAARIEER